MYTVVVMAALTTGGEAPAFGHHGGYYHSCYGCYGYGCYSAGYNGYNGYNGWGSCWGCYGSWVPSYSATYGPWSCSGCYGCWSSSPYFQMHHPDTPTMPPADPEKKKTSIEPDRARLLVEVPADAKLFIDDQATRATSSVRTFRTPNLQAGQTYYYILRVELERDKETHSETRR